MSSSENRFLVMRDRGTTGLTGKVLEPREYLEELPEEERWGRFESLAFTKETRPRSLGSRGQDEFPDPGRYTVVSRLWSPLV